MIYKIAIIGGTGKEGKGLAYRWAKFGHEVVIGSRAVEKAQAAADYVNDLINEKKLEGISYINDESDRNGVRVVIICKKDAQANVVLNNLFKMI